jgi:hypothetical protein
MSLSAGEITMPRTGLALLTLVLCVAVAPASMAVTPPELISYQGVLRSAAGSPLDGIYDMTFRFSDAPTGGTLLLTDYHTGPDAVVVSGGLFTVLLGGGTLSPGTESSLQTIFANYAAPDEPTSASERNVDSIDPSREEETPPPVTPAPEIPSALAARYVMSDAVEPGDVVVVDGAAAGALQPGRDAYDRGVVGVVAFVDGRIPPGETTPVAVAGVVPCRVDADYGWIEVGDLLVVSPTPGHAMRAHDPPPGSILGKALESLEAGRGTIRILLLPR